MVILLEAEPGLTVARTPSDVHGLSQDRAWKARKPGTKVPGDPLGQGVQLSSRTPQGGSDDSEEKVHTEEQSFAGQGDEATGTSEQESPIGNVTSTDHRRALATHTLKGPSPILSLIHI